MCPPGAVCGATIAASKVEGHSAAYHAWSGTARGLAAHRPAEPPFPYLSNLRGQRCTLAPFPPRTWGRSDGMAFVVYLVDRYSKNGTGPGSDIQQVLVAGLRNRKNQTGSGIERSQTSTEVALRHVRQGTSGGQHVTGDGWRSCSSCLSRPMSDLPICRRHIEMAWGNRHC